MKQWFLNLLFNLQAGQMTQLRVLLQWNNNRSFRKRSYRIIIRYIISILTDYHRPCSEHERILEKLKHTF